MDLTALARSIIDANLYRAVASQHFMHDPDRKPDQRTRVAV
jgi:hypothetical protein